MEKRFAFSVMAIAMLSLFTFTSCGSDSDDDGGSTIGGNSSEIVGEWAVQQYDDSGAYLLMESINFKSNGTFSVLDYDVYLMNGTIVEMEKAEYTGNYTAKDGQLTLSANGRNQSYTYRVSGSVLTLMGNDGSLNYDKMDDNIRSVFSSAESTYKERFKR